MAMAPVLTRAFARDTRNRLAALKEAVERCGQKIINFGSPGYRVGQQTGVVRVTGRMAGESETQFHV